jgi:hypothetical protein
MKDFKGKNRLIPKCTDSSSVAMEAKFEKVLQGAIPEKGLQVREHGIKLEF